MPSIPTLSEQIYFDLKNKILNGEILPGQALREENLAANMGTSRTPVRTALKMLFSEGFLSQAQDRSLSVTTVSLKELRDTLIARKIVEGAIAELACSRATPHHIDRLEHFIYDEEMAHKDRNKILVVAADRRFHAYLAEITDNPVLQEFQEKLGNKTSLFLAITSTLGEEIFYALGEHRKLLEAIKEGTPEESRNAMLEHLKNIETRIFLRLEARNQ